MESELEASGNVVILERGDTKIYLIGTAHISQASIDEVERVIRTVKPDLVCPELHPAHAHVFSRDDVWRELDPAAVALRGQARPILSAILADGYRRYLGQQFGGPAASLEFLAAAATGREVGAQVVLVDRRINITMARTWANMSLKGKWTLLQLVAEVLFDTEDDEDEEDDEGDEDGDEDGDEAAEEAAEEPTDDSNDELTADEIEALKDQDAIPDMLDELSELLPGLREPFIDERDRYMMATIAAAAAAYDQAEGGKTVVAVVGAAHLPGMKAAFEHLADHPIDRQALEEIPPKPAWISLAQWSVPVLASCAWAYGTLSVPGTAVQAMMTAWALPNALAAAAATMLARGKPLSIAAAAAIAPVIALIPRVGAGHAIGWLEAQLRAPSPEDCGQISTQVHNIAGIYQNPATRVLLVALLSTAGAAVGAGVGLVWLWLTVLL